MQVRSSRDVALLVGQTGRWKWPWALLGTSLVVFLSAGFYLLLLPIEVRVGAQFGPPLDANIFLAAGRPDTFLNFLNFSAALIGAVLIVLYLVHRQTWRAALGPLQRFDWNLFAKSALALFLVTVVSTGFDYWRAPGSMRLLEHGWNHLPWLLLGTAVIFPQALAEDYVFKGYLLRTWGAIVPVRLVAIPLCAGAFTALHAGNSDIGTDVRFNVAAFLLIELLSFSLVLRTGSIATATGLHWMNNVFAMCLITTVPGQPSNFALIEYAHPLLMAGGSKSSDPIEIASLCMGIAALWGLLSWPRSPLYLPSANYPDRQSADPTIAPEQPPPESSQTAEGSSAEASR